MTKACSLADLREAVADISVGRLLKTDRRLKILRDQLDSDVITDTPARRADIAARLEEMSLLGGLLNRTRRRDVAEIQIKRRAACRIWSMTDGERSFYDRASATIREYAYRNDINDGFLLSNTQRVLASSLAAAFLRWSRLETDLGTDEDGGDEEVDGVGPLVAALNGCCRDRSDYEALKAGDSKHTLFRTALDDTWKAAPEEKVIVFSSFRGTIDYLAERLKADGVPFEKLHGSIKDGRMDVLARFSKARGRCVLLSSEIGSEGLDLQFCRLLINYDLPWNPMRVEQRIGRIDRIGQVAPSVEIFSLICEATIEEKIYHRLYERLNLIERSLGGFEPILGDIIAELQDRLLDPSLSPEDVDREIERAVLSAETRKKHEEALEAEAPGLIAHGDMILQRIKRTHEQQGWIGAQELYEYARLGLQTAYPHSTLDQAPIEPVAYDLRLCAAGHDAFRKFLETSSRRYPTRLRRNASARVVFGKNTDALPEADVEVLHAGHPFIRFLGRVQDRGALGAARPAVWGERTRVRCPPIWRRGALGS
ncbi:MAG: DEAD/DEAH box helicase [Hyphomonadaceae bacterium]|nr:DEAD/DEAH box helicase [Hyphomonadaceae bacterium]